ncbi:RES family NAD+ phosphorylase [Streptomyces aidingensis]|uniref:RES domain-containing protein n=1 Tax=Streptomyces aidingensis TaxID=910347 RepID=A0A1I1QUH4_9ACTN|nr:RES family NAD+ phosphorylase [Streptomyces aidingensis]SFD25771.1 RES domain-containing protein [Streptomyces aidingensis]
MARQHPPPGLTPRSLVLPAGSELWRCHRTRRQPEEFNPTVWDTPFKGARFDSTPEDPYSYLYAGAEPATALAEVFLRQMEFDAASGMRIIPWAQAAPYSLTRLRTTVELPLIRLLTEEDLAAVCQDSWLLETDVYVQTRYWVRQLRARAPWATGVVWQSRRHRPRHACVLFGDRAGGAGALKPEPESSLDLGTPQGLAGANELLYRLRAVIQPPQDA